MQWKLNEGCIYNAAEEFHIDFQLIFWPINNWLFAPTHTFHSFNSLKIHLCISHARELRKFKYKNLFFPVEMRFSMKLQIYLHSHPYIINNYILMNPLETKQLLFYPCIHTFYQITIFIISIKYLYHHSICTCSHGASQRGKYHSQHSS